MNLVEDYCEHYCIIDRQMVWYGSMNFLGKEDAEDNLMRIADEPVGASDELPDDIQLKIFQYCNKIKPRYIPKIEIVE